ncbi:hypothetical protein NLG42_05365 [Flavobacterium plurextorum]|uniref:hypothetical protein n=1 Tax=Flavobacterium TaxID=237 RepID=UPI00214D298F|nr:MULTISPECIES: hypothetical protein [Flavobacterium]UUW10233.1 hypothetical protein NLG42_05365 [Flavobacterium plurextorum]
MVDYTKIYLINIDVQKLLKSKVLDFKSTISKTTGEINESVFIAKYHFCEITIQTIKEEGKPERTHVFFIGSIHKMWNELNGIKAPNYDEKKLYKGFNGNQFTLNDIVEVRTHLEDLFDCKASQMIFQNIEFGVNLILDYNPILFIKGLLYHKNIMFEFSHKGNSARVIHCNFIIKIYNKSYQYGMSENVIRIELKTLKMEELKGKGIPINTFEDINENTLDKVSKLLIKRFSEIRHYDYSIDKKKLTERKLNEAGNYSNPRYWINDLEPNERDRYLKRLDSITTKFSKKRFQRISIEIGKKCSTINRLFADKTKKEINKKCSVINRVFKNSFCSTVNPLDKELNIIQNTLKKEIGNESKNDEVKKQLLSYKEQRESIEEYNRLAVLNYNSRYV